MDGRSKCYPIEIEGVNKTSTDVQGATQKETPTLLTIN